jgi:uncharacterized membrane protein YfcA
MYVEPQNVSFVLALTPFFVAGISLFPTAQDWSRGVLNRADAIAVTFGIVIAAAWYCAILHSVRAKRRQGKEKLLGRALSSWLWAPPVTFAVGFVSGWVLCMCNLTTRGQ